MVAFLNKSEGSEDFHQIIDFLTISHINTSENEEIEITATIDGRVKTITQASIRRHLKLEDADGISSLPNTEIFEQLALMGSKFLMYPRFIQIFLNKHKRHLLPHKRTYVAPTLTHKLFSNMRRVSKGYTRVDILLFPTMLTAPESSPSRITSSPSLSPQTHLSTSQQPLTPPFTQTIHDAEEPASMPHDSSQPRVQSLGSDEGSLTLNELTVLYTTLSKKVEDLQNDLKQKKLTYGAAYTKLILRVKKLEYKGRNSADTEILLEEPTKLLEDLVSIAAENLVYIRRSAEKRKGKAIMKEDESVQKKTKKQLEQERLSHEAAIRLQEQVNEEERQRIARDAEIAKQLQEEIDTARQEQEKSDLEKALELQKQYHAQQNRSFSKAEVRKNMCMYLNNQGGYKQSHFKGMSYEDIRPIFERVWDQNQSFVPKDSEIEKEVMKRSGFNFQKPPTKRQKIGEVSGSVEEQSAGKEKEVSEEELKKLVIRVGNHTEVYQVFEDMLKRFDRDNLEKLWDLVKKKFSSTEPTLDKEKVLWVELKRLFELGDDDTLWKLQRYMHDPLKWRLYNTCGVHHVSTERGHDIFMLVEKNYPLTRALMTVMLANKLQVDESSEMANELLRKIFY
ncbi:hypothetical protein Tco_1177333 [Tanacetum coccineum]